MTRQVEIRLLGPLSVDVEGEPVRLGGQRERILLSTLAISCGATVTPERLIDVIWPVTPPETARAQIATCVSRLRRSLSSAGIDAYQVVRTDPQGYRLGPGSPGGPVTVWVDAVEFESRLASARELTDDNVASAVAELRRALSLWRGEPFAGLDGLSGESRRLGEERMSALTTCLDLELRSGNHRAVAGELHAEVSAEPTREQLRSLLMLALYRCGNRAAALEVYREGRRLLRNDIGIEPGPEMTRVHQLVLDDEVPAPRVPPPVRQANHVPPRQLPFSPRHFVGRTREMGAMDYALLPSSSDLSPGGVVITGVAGIGKSELAVRWAAAHRDSHPDGELYADFSDEGSPDPGRHLERFLRGLGVTPDGMPDALGDKAAEFRSRTVDRQMLILLDNASHADSVAALLPASPSCRVIVTGSAELRDLVVRTDFHHLELGAMDKFDCLELADRLAGEGSPPADREGAEQLHRITGGRPRDVREHAISG